LSGPFEDGTYLVGTDIAPGNYKCSKPDSLVYWEIKDFDNEIMELDLSAVARVSTDGYTAELGGCLGQWAKVG
jgi:hypothetical protein